MVIYCLLILLFVTLSILMIYLLHGKLYKKRAFPEMLYLLLENNVILVLAAEILIIIIALITKLVPSLSDYFEKGFLSTIFLTVFVGIISNMLKRIWMNRLEDGEKLTTHYDSIISKYSSETNWISCSNAEASNINLSKLKKGEKRDVILPVAVDYYLYKKTIDIIDKPFKRYSIPEVLVPFEKELMAAHDTSNVYNQLNIRVDDWGFNGSAFTIQTSRTTYFSSLMTNRAMDYKLSNYMTVRDIVQYGPFLPQLRESVLSNHLGFNGLVISKDGKFPIVKRSKDMSIGKRTYGTSVGASLKAKYSLNEKYVLTPSGILNSIIREIEDELKIPKEGLFLPTELEDIVICSYRDIVEGNKPQLLFVIKSNMSSSEIHKHFTLAMKNKAKQKVVFSSERRDLEDGEHLKWISLEELHDAIYLTNRMIISGKSYPMVPSAVASIYLVKQFFDI